MSFKTKSELLNLISEFENNKKYNLDNDKILYFENYRLYYQNNKNENKLDKFKNGQKQLITAIDFYNLIKVKYLTPEVILMVEYKAGNCFLDSNLAIIKNSYCQ